MTDKVQKIREGVEKLKSQLLRGACSSQVVMETMCKEEAYNEVLAILDTMQKEPVSEKLDKAVVEYMSQFSGENYYNSPWVMDSTGMAMPKELARFGAKWQKQQMMAKAIDGIARPDDGEIWCDLKSFNFKDGDKVKVIVIKEE